MLRKNLQIVAIINIWLAMIHLFMYLGNKHTKKGSDYSSVCPDAIQIKGSLCC